VVTNVVFKAEREIKWIILQSVKMLSRVVELFLGANFTTLVEIAMSEYPDIRHLY
jgi:hypothetical protein